MKTLLPLTKCLGQSRDAFVRQGRDDICVIELGYR